MSYRRNYVNRAIAALVGDMAVATTVAAGCAWVIETASFGLFLAFMAWLVGLFIWLTLSQHAVHPFVAALLSDRKLDEGITLSERSIRKGVFVASCLWTALQQSGLVMPTFIRTH